jgi:hypothetical protein
MDRFYPECERRGMGGIGKLSEVPAVKTASQDANPIAISTSHPLFWALFILVGEGKIPSKNSTQIA